MTELSAQQLHDLMAPLWERCSELSPKGLMFDYIQQSNEYSSPSVPVLYPMLHGRWIESPCFPEEAVDGTASATQLCESSMVRQLAKWVVFPLIARSRKIWRVAITITGKTTDFYAPTLVEALAAACNAYLDAEEEPA